MGHVRTKIGNVFKKAGKAIAKPFRAIGKAVKNAGKAVANFIRPRMDLNKALAQLGPQIRNMVNRTNLTGRELGAFIMARRRGLFGLFGRMRYNLAHWSPGDENGVSPGRRGIRNLIGGFLEK